MKRRMQRRLIQQLVLLLMAINIISVGYATWTITESASNVADGGQFKTYPVAYYVIDIDPNFQAYCNGEGVDGETYPWFIPEGNLTEISQPTVENVLKPTNQGTITLTYTSESDQTAKITTTVMFSSDPEISKLFFNTAKPTDASLFSKDGIEKYSFENFYNEDTGTLTFTFEPKDKDKLVITLNTLGNVLFADDICKGSPYAFVVKTMIESNSDS